MKAVVVKRIRLAEDDPNDAGLSIPRHQPATST
jgi:hypothetical protein